MPIPFGFLTIWACTLAICLGALATFNIFTDPYDIFAMRRIEGLNAYLKDLIASMTDETSEPVALGNVELPTSETSEPLNVN